MVEIGIEEVIFFFFYFQWNFQAFLYSGVTVGYEFGYGAYKKYNMLVENAVGYIQRG